MERNSAPSLLTHSAFEPAADGEQPAGDGTAQRTFGFSPNVQPEIWVSGHSERATRLTGEWGDCLFLNGTPEHELARHIAEARQMAMRWGRRITIALNAFVIATETSQQARERRDRVVQRRNDETIAFFRGVMEASGAAAWADLNDEQMVDSNSGFDAGLIGSFAEVRERLDTLARLGVDKIVCQFDDPMRDVGPFMQRVIRPLREAMPAL
jgi:FMNH2-dependent dimethyl sulfone monooxygenase